MQLQPGSKGQRLVCPSCGKMLKVPGGAAPQASASDQPSGESSGAQRPGIANIPLVCPFCSARMYAQRSQVGQTMVCPECLETVAVEVPGETPVADPEERLPIQPPPPPTPSSTTDDADDAEDEFRLSEPTARPTAAFWNADLAEVIDDVTSAESATPTDSGVSPPEGEATALPPTPPAGPPAQEFRVKCQVCDTMIYVTTDEIGTTKKCPDCYTSFEVQKPAAAKLKPVVDVMQDADDFALSEPVERVVFKDLEADLTGRTVEQQHVEKAEEERKTRQAKRPKLPQQPLWTGVFRFLASGEAMLAMVFIAGIFWTLAMVSLVGVAYGAGGGLGVFISMICAVAVMALVLTGGAYAAVVGLRVLQETAAGADTIESWPDLAFLDWCMEAIYVAVAFAYSMTPGIVISWFMNRIGLSPAVGFVVSMVSLFAFFPIVLLSLMEADSLAAPLTRPIRVSLDKDRSHWMVFYLESVAILIIMLLAAALIYAKSWLALLLAAAVWSFCWMVYFRLLGRLAWIAGTHQNAE
jgi:DNA-directed RNA polymerase subunit M/transcription elongation factor TFIIS